MSSSYQKKRKSIFSLGASRSSSSSKRAKPSNYVARRGVPRFVPGYNRTGGFYGRFAGRGAELKFFDTTLSFNIDATGEVPATGQLNLIPQGITESTRVGRKCVIKSIQLKGNMQLTPGAAATLSGVSNIYLILDKQCNGAAAGATDVFTTDVFNTALRNLANSERFVILKKWRHVWNIGAGVGTALNSVHKSLDYYKKCNYPIEFSSTTGAITEIKSNNLFLMAGTGTTMDDLISVAGTSRLRFSDN